MKPRPDRHRNGFTLIEVLIAFMILGVASLALFSGMTTGLSGTDTSEKRITAMLLARSKLDEVGASIPVAPGVQTGISGGGIRWSVEITSFFNADNIVALEDSIGEAPSTVAVYQIAVTVAGRDGFPVTLTSWRLAPGS